VILSKTRSATGFGGSVGFWLRRLEGIQLAFTRPCHLPEPLRYFICAISRILRTSGPDKLSGSDPKYRFRSQTERHTQHCTAFFNPRCHYPPLFPPPLFLHRRQMPVLLVTKQLCPLNASKNDSMIARFSSGCFLSTESTHLKYLLFLHPSDIVS
jgi:hypothetical protein